MFHNRLKSDLILPRFTLSQVSSEYIHGGLPRNNPCSSIVIPRIVPSTGCRNVRVYYMEAPKQEGAQANKACKSVHSAIPRFGFQVKLSKVFLAKLEAVITKYASNEGEKQALYELFDRYAASLEDITKILKAYNAKKKLRLVMNAINWEEQALESSTEPSPLARAAGRNVVSASCAANGGHRDNYGGKSNDANERIEVKMTIPAPKCGSYRFPCKKDVYGCDWAHRKTRLSKWTDKDGPYYGRAPPGCLVYPELLLGTICYWNADIEGHVLDRMFHCSARVGVPEDYLQQAPGQVSDVVRNALLKASRGVWGLSADGTPRYYPHGGVVTMYRALL